MAVALRRVLDAVLGRLHASVRLHTNVLQPSFKLKSKTRICGRVRIRHHPLASALDRVGAHAEVDKPGKLRVLHGNADPMVLHAQIRAGHAGLGERVPARPESAIVDLERFCRQPQDNLARGRAAQDAPPPLLAAQARLAAAFHPR